MGCGRANDISILGNSENENSHEHVSILEAEQVVASKRTEYERAVLGLELLGKDGIPLSWCTSVLIRPDVVLTAGHCFDPHLLSGIDSVRVQTTTDLNTARADDPGSRRIVKTVMHPEFDSHGVVIEGVRYPRHDHDLALAIMDRPVDASIVPQRLIESKQSIAGKKIRIYGFGKSVCRAVPERRPANMWIR